MNGAEPLLQGLKVHSSISFAPSERPPNGRSRRERPSGDVIGPSPDRVVTVTSGRRPTLTNGSGRACLDTVSRVD
jgi:hypothetical protein